MFCSILSAAIYGVDAVPIWVEADVSSGMPVFSMVGFVSSQVREAQDRVRTALRNLGILLPPKRITINLSPGDIRKEGTQEIACPLSVNDDARCLTPFLLIRESFSTFLPHFLKVC